MTVSTAALPIITLILAPCFRRWGTHNARDGVRDLFLYRESRAMQALEGEKMALRKLLPKTERDYLHRDLIHHALGPFPRGTSRRG